MAAALSAAGSIPSMHSHRLSISTPPFSESAARVARRRQSRRGARHISDTFWRSADHCGALGWWWGRHTGGAVGPSSDPAAVTWPSVFIGRRDLKSGIGRPPPLQPAPKRPNMLTGENRCRGRKQPPILISLLGVGEY